MWVASCLLVTIAFSGPGSDDIQRAARKVLSDSDYQSELRQRDPADPNQLEPRDFDPPPDPGTTPAGGDGVRDPDGRDMRRRAPGTDRTARRRPEDLPQRRREVDSSSGSMDLSQLFTVLMWTVLAVVAVILIVWLVNALTGFKKNAQKKDVKAAATAVKKTATLVRPKSEAEMLAEQGKFGEAIHVLLLLTLAELARRKEGGLEASLTSREIVANVPVPEPARPPLTVLVEAVEHSLFGGMEPGQAEFDTCLGQFNDFASAYAEGTA